MTESTLETTPQTPEGQSVDLWKTLAFSREALICLALSIFLVSPLIQLFVRFFGRSKISRHQYPDLTRYTNAIDATNKIMVLTAAALFLCFIAYTVYAHFYSDQIPAEHRISLLGRETAHRLVPYFFFVLFASGILVSTLVRGANSFDMTGHWYMHESIFSYIVYALAYFLCAMLLWSEKSKKFLLCLLIATALPLHILAIINECGTHISYFDAQGLSTSGNTAVFFNSNHYGYYIMITLLSSALLYVYEKNTALRVLEAACGVAATMILVINNTLGAYLASLFVLILFVVYCLTADRTHLKHAFLILGIFLLITILMSFRYNTILSSIIVLSDDISMIAENPLEADSGGSGRWRLWKETVRHMPEHPLVGFGIEGLLSLYGIGTPHNEFMQYAAFFGIPVMLYYITACAVVLWRIFRNQRQMSSITMICFFVSIGYLASSFFGVTIFYTTPFFYILLGMTYAEYLKNGQQAINGSVEVTSIDPDSDAAGGSEMTSSDSPEIFATEDQTPSDTTGADASVITAQVGSHNAEQADSDGSEYNNFNAMEQNSQSIAQAREQGLAEGLARGRREGAELLLISMVCKKLQKGKTAAEIADELDEVPSKIEAICEAAVKTAPDYDVDLIYHSIVNE